MDNKNELAQDIVKSHMVYSLGAGLVPVPILDIAAVTAVQLDMLRQLSKLYGKDFKEASGKSWITAITGSTLARMGASMVKTVPLIGSILGGVTMSILSGASTYAVGQVFIKHFSNGGDWFNFDTSKAKEIYKKEFEKGKSFAKEMEKKQNEDSTVDVNIEKDLSPADIFDKIEKLAELKEKGAITEEEFKTQKEKLLAKL